MRPTVNTNRGDADRLSLRALRVILAVLTTAVILVVGYLILGGSGGAGPLPTIGDVLDDETDPVAVADSSSFTTSSSLLSLATFDRPPLEARTVIPLTEAEPEAKQLAADIAYALTTYEAGDDHHERLEALPSRHGVDELARASAPLTHPGYWSRGEVIYPQLGGLDNDLASVMVVTRQTVGTESEAAFSVVRTLDIRLLRGESGWEFDFLSDAGGSFDRVEDLATAHAIANDPRIVMPDSARLDILSGLVSPTLLQVMADLAEQSPFEVVVLATGHPHNVFETDRLSHHTVGQAVDINRIGGRLVIEDRDPDSVTRATVEWLLSQPHVLQVGSPWDTDGEGSPRSFTNEVHQDHIHLAVEDG
jgi:hypothetical protein